jgi:serine phosphatase RsbU (regulator of sigma subunit)
MPWLKMLKGETPGTAFPLDRDITVLGRDAACEIVLTDSQVSKRHARIIRKDDGFHIEDLGSVNGTRVGNRDLTGMHRLEDGNLIQIGSTLLAYAESDTTIVGTVEPSTESDAEIAGTRLMSAKEDTTVLSAVDPSTQTDAQVAQVRPEEKLQAILEIARDLGGTIDLDGVLEKVLETLFRILPQAERGFILLKNQPTGDLIPKARRLREQEGVSPTFSRTVFDLVTSEGQALLCEDVGADPRLGHSPSVRESQIRTIMCVPLRDRQRCPFGVLQIDTRDERGRFQPEDLDLLVAVASPISVAIENARLHEISVEHAKWEREAQDARAVQLAMIPRRKPHLPGYEFWDFYEPARHVGGDYFDYRPLPTHEHPPTRWAITLGDVTGKGMPAALLMARLSAEVGLLLQTEPDPARVVERLNRNLCQAEMEEMFVTFLLVLIDSERNELTVVNAGHMGPMIRRSDGQVEVIGEEQSGFMLGLLEGTAYVAARTSIGCGDVVVLYTDGVNEAMDSERRQFGFEGLREALVQAPGSGATAGGAILDAVRRHAAGCDQSDDITLLCFGRT